MNLLTFSCRDTLFSFHKASEAFLHKIMSLYVASHYKVLRLILFYWGENFRKFRKYHDIPFNLYLTEFTE